MDERFQVIEAKLGDFGLCARIENPFLSNLTMRCGTWGYMAPEQLRGERYNEVVYK